MAYYSGRHRTQYDGSALANQNCAATSIANGIRCATGGRIDMSGAQVRALVAINEEENPSTPGWTLRDCALAVSRIPGAPAFAVRSGDWANLETSRRAGLFICLPGDSDRFPDGTCSGRFDGDHMVGLNPNGTDAIMLADPICPTWRTEAPATLNAYATKFAGSSTFRYGVFLTPVPELEEDAMFPVVSRTLLSQPNPRLFIIPPNTVVNGYDPARPGVVVATAKTGASPSSASAVAEVSVAWQGVPAGGSAPIPRGGPFLEVADGVLAGLLIVKSLVTLETPAPTYSEVAYKELERRLTTVKGKAGQIAAVARDIADD